MLSTEEVLNLQGKVAVITGAASGIGLAASQLLAQFGAHVALLDIDIEKGSEAARQIIENGGTATCYKCDVSSAAECRAVTQTITEATGRIDILFNNTGIIRRQTVVDMEEKDWANMTVEKGEHAR